MKRLTTFARYGAGIDKDIGRALQALRTLRNRPDAWIDELRNDTSEPDACEPPEQNGTIELPQCTPEPELGQPRQKNSTYEFAVRTSEPEPPLLDRRQRRRLQAMARKRRAA